MKILFLIISLCFACHIYTQITFEKRFGGSGYEHGKSVRQTADGGYIICGLTSSYGAGLTDVLLIKTNVYGDTLWTKTFGGVSYDVGYKLEETNDGGFIIVGDTDSFDGDILLLKTDSEGNTQWMGNIENEGISDGARSVKQTTDGGYIISGNTYEWATDYNFYLVKTDPGGNVQWRKNYGDSINEQSMAVIQTSDGGYIVTGNSRNGFGIYDIYVVKTNSTGDTLWTKTFGGTGTETAYSVLQDDDGYIIGGSTSSFGNGDSDFYIIKMNLSGDSLWSKTYGGVYPDYCNSLVKTSDGGYIAAGTSNTAVDSDCFLIKLDANGDSLWTKKIGDLDNFETGTSIQQTADGGFIVTGSVKGIQETYDDVFLFKTDCIGNSTFWDNTACSLAGTVTLEQNELALEIYPNPFSSFTTIRFSDEIQNAEIVIYNTFGQKLKTLTGFYGKEFIIHRGDFPKGVYVLQVKQNKSVLSKKLIISD